MFCKLCTHAHKRTSRFRNILEKVSELVHLLKDDLKSTRAQQVTCLSAMKILIPIPQILQSRALKRKVLLIS